MGEQCSHEVRGILEVLRLETYRRWISDRKRGRTAKRSRRPKLDEKLRDLIERIARDNSRWGNRRIVGELKKLGESVGAIAVKRVLRDADIHPEP